MLLIPCWAFFFEFHQELCHAWYLETFTSSLLTYAELKKLDGVFSLRSCYTTGCVIGYYRSDDYNSMMNVLRGLTEEEKQNLVNEVQDLVGSTAVEDLTTFFGSRARRGALLNCIRHFLKGEYKTKLVFGPLLNIAAYWGKVYCGLEICTRI